MEERKREIRKRRGDGRMEVRKRKKRDWRKEEEIRNKGKKKVGEAGLTLGFFFFRHHFRQFYFFCAIFFHIEPIFGHFSPKNYLVRKKGVHLLIPLTAVVDSRISIA